MALKHNRSLWTQAVKWRQSNINLRKKNYTLLVAYRFIEEKWLLLYFQSLTFFLKEKVTVFKGYSSLHRSGDGPRLGLERCASANPQNWGADSGPGGEGAGSNSGLSHLSKRNITETCKALATRILWCWRNRMHIKMARRVCKETTAYPHNGILCI